MTDNEENKPDLIAQMDQLGTTLENWASIIGNYYVALVKAGIPNDLAAELVHDFHKFHVTRTTP